MPLPPPIQPNAEVFGPAKPGKSDAGSVAPRPSVEQTGALDPLPSGPSEPSVVKTPPPKPKPKRQKAQAKADPGAPLVLVPPQKNKPRRREPNLFERLFGRLKGN